MRITILIAFVAVVTLIAADFKHQPQIAEWLPGKEILMSLRLPEYQGKNLRADADKFTMDGQAGEVNHIEIVAQPANNDENFDYELSEIVAAMNDENLSASEQSLSAFVEKKPKNSEAWRYLGDCRYNLGDISGALRAYGNARQQQPNNYWAKRGQGIAQLYLAYDFYAQNSLKVAHQYFQDALRDLHECLETSGDDPIASYGQALAAEGVSRELYRIAMRAIGGENEETAKNIIRNCLDILDVAIAASQDRIVSYPSDTDARLLLGSLFLRRARILEPFGHLEEAGEDVMSAVESYQVVIGYGGDSAIIARAQTYACADLLKRIRNN